MAWYDDAWNYATNAGDTVFNSGSGDTGWFTAKDLANIGLGGWGLYQGQQSTDTANKLASLGMLQSEEDRQWWRANIGPQQEAQIEQEMRLAGFNKTPVTDESGNTITKWTLSPEATSNIETQRGMQTKALGMEQSNLDFMDQMLPRQQEIAKMGLENAKVTTGLQGRILGAKVRDLDLYNKFRPIEESYYNEALNVPDREAMAGKYAADTINALDNAQRMSDIRMGMAGVLPGSRRSVATVNANMADRALAIASAKNQGRTAADTIKFDKLSSAINARKGLAPASLQTAGSALGVNSPTVKFATLPGVPTQAIPNNQSMYNNLINLASNAAGQNNSAGMQLILRGLNSGG